MATTSTTSPARAILVTGATGKQGGSVISALLSLSQKATSPRPPPFELLAVTRDPASTSSRRLSAKSTPETPIKLVRGNLDDPTSIFAAARSLTPNPIWGVFSVQVAIGSSAEAAQGKGLVDAARAAGVRFFVQTSVDRGGDARSPSNPTAVPHFYKKHEIEEHLKKMAASSSSSGAGEREGEEAKMDYAILRPVAFYENLTPDFFGRVFATSYRDVLGGEPEKPLQQVSVADIGFFAAQAFANPSSWAGKEISLAGDELTYSEYAGIFKEVTGQEMPHTYAWLAGLVRWMIKDLGIMYRWFRDEGYGADIPELKKMNPDLKDFRTWLREESAWAKNKKSGEPEGKQKTT